MHVWWGRSAGDARQEAHALLIRAAAGRLGLAPGALTVSHEPGGRPCLPGIGLHVSISHCRSGLVAVALSAAGPVGVDVELVRPLPWHRMARRNFDPAEADWLEGLPVGRQSHSVPAAVDV